MKKEDIDKQKANEKELPMIQNTMFIQNTYNIF